MSSRRQLGGTMEETVTRFNDDILASRRASSKELSLSECTPTPLVRKTPLGTRGLTTTSLSVAMLSLPETFSG